MNISDITHPKQSDIKVTPFHPSHPLIILPCNDLLINHEHYYQLVNWYIACYDVSIVKHTLVYNRNIDILCWIYRQTILMQILYAYMYIYNA